MYSCLKKKLLFLLIFLPGLCGAQEYLSGHLAENGIDETTHDTIRRNYWQVMERAGLNKKLNTYYRITSINGEIFLELKVIEGGDVFVVPRNGRLRLFLEDGEIIILRNMEYQVSCVGCGARGYVGSSAQGTTLTFPVNAYDLHMLRRKQIFKIGLNTGEGYIEKQVNATHSELFIDELNLVAGR